MTKFWNTNQRLADDVLLKISLGTVARLVKNIGINDKIAAMAAKAARGETMPLLLHYFWLRAE